MPPGAYFPTFDWHKESSDDCDFLLSGNLPASCTIGDKGYNDEADADNLFSSLLDTDNLDAFWSEALNSLNDGNQSTNSPWSSAPQNYLQLVSPPPSMPAVFMIANNTGESLIDDDTLSNNNKRRRVSGGGASTIIPPLMQQFSNSPVQQHLPVQFYQQQQQPIAIAPRGTVTVSPSPSESNRFTGFTSAPLEETDESKKERNRLHAKASRQRRKSLTEDLQVSLEALQAENVKLRQFLMKKLGSKSTQHRLRHQKYSKPSLRFVQEIQKHPGCRVMDSKALNVLKAFRKTLPKERNGTKKGQFSSSSTPPNSWMCTTTPPQTPQSSTPSRNAAAVAVTATNTKVDDNHHNKNSDQYSHFLVVA